MKRSHDIPRRFIRYCVALRPVLGISGISQIGWKLFTDPAVISALGFSLIEIEEGFASGKNKKKENVPCNLDAFYDELVRLAPGDWRRLLSGQITLLAKKVFCRIAPEYSRSTGPNWRLQAKPFKERA